MANMFEGFSPRSMSLTGLWWKSTFLCMARLIMLRKCTALDPGVSAS